MIAGSALNVLPRLSDGAYDLVFIDADKLEYPAYVEQGVRLLRHGGVLAMDNALWQDRVADPNNDRRRDLAIRDALAWSRENEDLCPALLPVGDGLLAAIKELSARSGCSRSGAHGSPSDQTDRDTLADHGDAALGDGVAARQVGSMIDTDVAPVGHQDVLVQDGPLDPAPSPIRTLLSSTDWLISAPSAAPVRSVTSTESSMMPPEMMHPGLTIGVGGGAVEGELGPGQPAPCRSRSASRGCRG